MAKELKNTDKKINQKTQLFFQDPVLFWPFWKVSVFRILNTSFVFLGFIFFLTLAFLQIERWSYLGIILTFFFIYVFVRQNFSNYPLREQYLQKGKVNLASFLSPSARDILLATRCFAERKKLNFSIALLYVFLTQRKIKYSLYYLDLTDQDLKDLRAELVKVKGDKESFTQFIDKLMPLALKEALILNKSSLDEETLFLALLDLENATIDEILEKQRLKKNDFAIAFVLNRLSRQRRIKLVRGLADMKALHYRPHFKRNRANASLTSRPTPLLDVYGTDLTDLAEEMKIGTMIGHQKEYQNMINLLTQEGKKNVLLVGSPQTGKQTIVSYLAFNLVRENVPKRLLDYRLVELSISSLLENAKSPLEVADRLMRIVKEVLNNQNIVLFLPNFSGFKLFTQEGGLSILKTLESLFNSFQTPILATSTLRDYHRYLENDSVVEENFNIVKVKPVSREEAIKILAFQSLSWQRSKKIRVSYQAIKRSVMLAERFLATTPLPASAESLLTAAIEGAKNKRRKSVGETDIVNLVMERTEIPLEIAIGVEKEKLLHMEELIHRKFINQDEAVKLVASAMRQYRAGLKHTDRPIASFLFVGPTGVGKTELAKILAQIYFGSRKAMIRFDMSEYQDRKSILRFIGSANRENPGVLTEAVKANPFSLILLDEFEKAQSNVLNIFLSVFDEGRLTDNSGEVIDFTNTIIIATSNALSTMVKKKIEQGIPYSTLTLELKKRLTNVLRPELVNRFDEVVVFRPLTEENLQKIVKLQLDEFSQEIRKETGLKISFSREVIAKIAVLGYDPSFGARPLRSVIRHFIKDPLAEGILKGMFKKNDEIVFTYEKERFNINKAN